VAFGQSKNLSVGFAFLTHRGKQRIDRGGESHLLSKREPCELVWWHMKTMAGQFVCDKQLSRGGRALWTTNEFIRWVCISDTQRQVEKRPRREISSTK
jgi:hypothetical protein